jgi:hypothetical protein
MLGKEDVDSTGQSRVRNPRNDACARPYPMAMTHLGDVCGSAGRWFGVDGAFAQAVAAAHAFDLVVDYGTEPRRDAIQPVDERGERKIARRER